MKAQREAEEKLKAQQLRYELLKHQYSDVQDSDDTEKCQTGTICNAGGTCSNSITGNNDTNLMTRSCANIGLYISNTTEDDIINDDINGGVCDGISGGGAVGVSATSGIGNISNYNINSGLGSQYGGNSTRRSSSVIDHREIDDRLLNDPDEIEATRRLIQRRRRLFSHHRQYEIWRKRQFSYDSYHYRPIIQSSGPAARRRRLYRRQYSCVERSEGSRDSHDSRYYIPSIDGNKRNSIYSYSFEGSDTGTIVSPSKPKLSHFHYLQEEPSVTIAERCTRSRINSAIFVSSEGRGFDSIEFLRRYGSQSVLCRKARSAENISNENRTRNFSNKRQWHTEDGATTRTKNQSIQGESIELAECHSMPIPQNQKIQLQNENFTSTATTTTTLNNNIIPITTIQPPTIITPGSHTATVTTANAVVGSISIETPPPHLRQQQKQQQYKDSQESKKSKSIDVDSETTIIIPPREAPVLTKQTKKLIHQKSTSSTPNTSYSRSPSGSPNHSPILINLKNHNTPKINTQLPTLSVSEPSPPHDTQEFL
ncbi:uncharacterized protein LOC129605778 isoform X2 [Condylostylus longicornis]|uniref:uncharacterized protein LOC129605778 isoform X2 n=1 Tax=Condylostylus longicornis TaxID=2530218 RepID=UPI00244DC3F0|nr:uncharacterized protein LOC129605778 isoform X2 [Condylostylus longicornis]